MLFSCKCLNIQIISENENGLIENDKLKSETSEIIGNLTRQDQQNQFFKEVNFIFIFFWVIYCFFFFHLRIFFVLVSFVFAQHSCVVFIQPVLKRLHKIPLCNTTIIIPFSFWQTYVFVSLLFFNYYFPKWTKKNNQEIKKTWASDIFFFSSFSIF